MVFFLAWQECTPSGQECAPPTSPEPSKATPLWPIPNILTQYGAHPRPSKGEAETSDEETLENEALGSNMMTDSIKATAVWIIPDTEVAAVNLAWLAAAYVGDSSCGK